MIFENVNIDKYFTPVSAIVAQEARYMTKLNKRGLRK